jgi:hypothetical protein
MCTCVFLLCQESFDMILINNPSFYDEGVTMSAFSPPISSTISDLTILEFILWTTNLRKHTNFIRLQILKLT